MNKIFIPFCGALSVALALPLAQAKAETVETTTAITVERKIVPQSQVDSIVSLTTQESPALPYGTHVINLAEFDTNNDKNLSRDEIGETLFKIYDSDGNMLIDNVEYERDSVLTLVPFEKENIYHYDFDGDGITDSTTVTSANFVETTMLTKFDGNNNGLSPHEFTALPFSAADIDNDHFISQREWHGSYISSLDAYNKSRPRLNN